MHLVFSYNAFNFEYYKFNLLAQLVYSFSFSGSLFMSKETIESQQADLQAKILSLLGSSAVVPSLSNSNNRLPVPQRPAARGQYSAQSTSNYVPSRPPVGSARPASRW